MRVNQSCRERGGQTDTDTDTDTDTQTDTDTDTDTHALARACSLSYILVCMLAGVYPRGYLAMRRANYLHGKFFEFSIQKLSNLLSFAGVYPRGYLVMRTWICGDNGVFNQLNIRIFSLVCA